MKIFFQTLSIVLLLSYTFPIHAQVPVLSSSPSSSATLFLDFDGHTATGTSWNGYVDGRVLYLAPSGLTGTQITEVFNRVAEDYRPFDLNITTDSTKFLAAPVNKRMRVIITTTSSWYPVAVGGISFVGSFTWGDDTPTFVFSAALGYRTKYISEAASHEAGHTLGLYHQAAYDANCNLTSSYNYGTGSGEIGWAPIMGVGYYQNMTLWNNGPVPYGCTEQQNDLNVITSYNGFGFRNDDHENSFRSATNLIFSSNHFTAKGIIEKNTDQDMFKFIIPSKGQLILDAIPYGIGANNSGSDLDMQVTLYNNSRDTLKVYNPANTLSLEIDTTLEAGTYYATIEGKGNEYAPNYASIGSYSLQANFIDHTTPLPLRQLELKGALKGNKHELNWLVEADEKVITQVIEQSSSGHEYTLLTTPSSDVRTYSYFPSNDETIFYRITVTFDNGKQYFSNIISLRKAAIAQRPHLNGNLIADHYLTVSSPGNYDFRIADFNGKILSQGKLPNGTSRINTAITSGGMYFISFSNGQEQWTEKFVKQ